MSQNLLTKTVGDVVEQAFRDNVESMRLLCIKSHYLVDELNYELNFKPGKFYTLDRRSEGYTAKTESVSQSRFKMYKDDILKKEGYKDALNSLFIEVSENDLVKVRFIYPHSNENIVKNVIRNKFSSEGYNQEFLSSLKLFPLPQADKYVTEVFWELPVNYLRFIDDLLSERYEASDWKWYEIDIDYADFESYGR